MPDGQSSRGLPVSPPERLGLPEGNAPDVRVDGNTTSARTNRCSKRRHQAYDPEVRTNRERAPAHVQAVVWIGLAILLVTVAAFVWLFVLGHGFTFPF